MNAKRTQGFTLIELMIVVVIIGVIVAIAYPNYSRWVIETRRADAHRTLTQVAALQEKFLTECNRYAIAGEINVGSDALHGFLG